MEETSKTNYFEEGLRYLQTGANQCFSKIRECGLGSNEAQKTVLELAELLKKKINLFCLSHIKIDFKEQDHQDPLSISENSRQQQHQKQLNSESKPIHRRRKRRHPTANLRLKQLVRMLRAKITQLKLGFADQIARTISRYELEKEGKNSNLKKNLSKNSKEPAKPKSAKREKQFKSGLSSINPNREQQPINDQNSLSEQRRDSISSLSKLLQKVDDKSVQIPIHYHSEDQLYFEQPLIKDLKTKLDSLYQNHLKSKERQKLKKMEIRLTRVANHYEDGVIGQEITVMAIKNESSYLIGTNKTGLKLIENETMIFSKSFEVENKRLNDIVYISHFDSYFLGLGNQIYRKNIDESPAFLYFDVGVAARISSCFRYSDLHQRLIITKDKENIAVVNLEAKEVEIEIETEEGDGITDFRLFGDKDDKVVATCGNGYILQFDLNYGEKIGKLLNSLKIELNGQRKEAPITIEVSKKDQYALVEIGQKSGHLCSRMMILKLESEFISIKASIDCFSQNLRDKYAISCFGEIGTRVVWVEASTHQALVQVFVYDKETNIFEELESKRVFSSENYPSKLHRLGDDYYFTGDRGTIVRMKLII